MKVDTVEGLRVYVYRNSVLGDCSAGGVSATHDKLTVVGTVDSEGVAAGRIRPLPPHSRVFPPRVDAPAVALRLDPSLGTVAVVPVAVEGDSFVPEKRWVMFGGNFAALGDSRFREIMGDQYFYGAIAIHDRIEKGNA